MGVVVVDEEEEVDEGVGFMVDFWGYDVGSAPVHDGVGFVIVFFFFFFFFFFGVLFRGWSYIALRAVKDPHDDGRLVVSLVIMVW